MNSPSGRRRTGGRGRTESPAATGPRHGSLRAFMLPFVALSIILLAIAILANSMTKEVGRDEQMYCTAGVLLAEGQMIYRDFSYPSQLPYHPLLLAALYRGLGTTHYLLVGRLVSAVSDILVVILIVAIYRSVFSGRRSEGLLFGLAAATLYVFNPFVDYAAGYAWNHDVVILCVVLSLWLLVSTDYRKQSRYWRIALMGVLLTVATGMRVTTVLVELAFLAGVFWLAGGSLRNRIWTAAPFSGTALVMLIWPAWVIVQAPQAFWLNLVRIPTLYGRWLHEIGMTFDKVALTINAILTPGYLVLLLLAGLLAWLGFRSRTALDGAERRKAALTALLPLVFLLIVYIPPTIWLQYLAMPVPFLAVALAYPLLALRRSGPAVGRRVMTVALPGAALLSLLVYPAVLSRAIFALVPEKWEPVRVHAISQALTRSIKEPGLVLTLGPLYALEGDCDIYPELSCGDIVYRIADRLTPEERQLTNTIGPETLTEMARNRPPAAVIVGVEPPRFGFLEEPLHQVAQPEWPREQVESLQVYRQP